MNRVVNILMKRDGYSKEEAMEIAEDGYDVIYEEKEWDGIEEVDDFAVDF